MKLKPCPFCGGEAKVIFDEESEHWRIRCKNIDCDVRPSTSWFYVKEEAIDRWNRRKPIDKIVDQLEQLSIGTVLCDKCAYREECDDIQEKYDPDDNTDLCTMVAKSLAIEIVKGGSV